MESRAHVLNSQSRRDLASSTLSGYVPMHSTVGKMARRMLPHGGIPHIAIIGAGFAGLRCADILSQRGLKVTIFEGRDRVGGRVYQFRQPDHVYDLGPNWIHGTDHNPILDLAKEVNATTFSIPDIAPSVYDDAGQNLPVDVATEHYDTMWSIIAEAFKHSKVNCAVIPPEESLMDYFMIKVKEKNLDDTSVKLVLEMARSWGDFVGEPIEKQSLKFFWLEECIEGENLYLASTYQAVLSKVAETGLAKAELHLSTKVKFVSSNPADGEGTSVTLTTSSDKIYNFDEIILTCPLGWLKRNTSSFTPSLPSDVLKAIEHISYGRLEKVYITFPTAFWQFDSPTRSFFSNFIRPTYTDQNPLHWTIECVSLASLPAPCSHATLLFYVHGPCAQHVTSLTEGLDPNSEKYHARLNDFFSPYYSRLPNHNPSSPDCQPSTILATNWQNDELAGWGSYTTFQTSQASEDVQLDKDIEVLREGCPERHIWFAGEHTAPFVALGTTTGAYWSGQAVAERVAGVYGMGGEGSGTT